MHLPVATIAPTMGAIIDQLDCMTLEYTAPWQIRAAIFRWYRKLS